MSSGSIWNFKPSGTKISIFNNKSVIMNLIFYSARWSNGDARDDLHNVFLPLTKAPIWYDVNKSDIQNIFKFAIRGLEKLKRSYSRNSTINHSIQYYITCLRNSIIINEQPGSGNGTSNRNNDNENGESRRSRRNRNENSDSGANSNGNGNSNGADSDDEHNTIFTIRNLERRNKYHK